MLLKYASFPKLFFSYYQKSCKIRSESSFHRRQWHLWRGLKLFSSKKTTVCLCEKQTPVKEEMCFVIHAARVLNLPVSSERGTLAWRTEPERLIVSPRNTKWSLHYIVKMFKAFSLSRRILSSIHLPFVSICPSVGFYSGHHAFLLLVFIPAER